MSVLEKCYQQLRHNQVQFESVTCDDYSKRCQRIQQRLVLLIHAKKCEIRENQNGTINCTWLHCLIMKKTLNHLMFCQSNNECLQPHCYSSKIIIKHWNSCIDITCDICIPLKQAEQKYKYKIIEQENDFQELIDCVMGLNSTDNQSNDLINYKNLLTTEKIKAISIDATQLTYKWQSCITDEIRNDNVNKMIKKLISPFDLNSLCDGKFDEISKHVKIVEKQFYKMSKSQDEYYSLIGLNEHVLKLKI